MEGIQGGTYDGLNVASQGCDVLQGIYSSFAADHTTHFTILYCVTLHFAF